MIRTLERSTMLVAAAGFLWVASAAPLLAQVERAEVRIDGMT